MIVVNNGPDDAHDVSLNGFVEGATFSLAQLSSSDLNCNSNGPLYSCHPDFAFKPGTGFKLGLLVAIDPGANLLVDAIVASSDNDPNESNNSATLFRKFQPRVVIAFEPTTGSVGTSVTVSGMNLSSAMDVSFNGTPSPIISFSETQVLTSVPFGATTGSITLNTLDGSFTTTDMFTVEPDKVMAHDVVWTDSDCRSCVSIVRNSQKIETNGRVVRLIGTNLGWNVVQSNIGARCFNKIQEAIDFVGVDERGVSLDFRSEDKVQLGPCTFTENIIIPAQHRQTQERLFRIILQGTPGTSTTSPTRIFGATEGSPVVDIQALAVGNLYNKMASLTVAGSSPQLIRAGAPVDITSVDVKGTRAPTTIAPITGLQFLNNGSVTDANFTNLTVGIESAAPFLNTITASHVDFDRVNTGVKTTEAKLLLDAFGWFHPQSQSDVAVDIKGGSGSRVNQGDAEPQGVMLRLDNAEDTHVFRLDGGRYQVLNSKLVFMDHVAATHSVGTAVAVNNSQQVNISKLHATDSSLNGCSISSSSGVRLSDSFINGAQLSLVFITDSKDILLSRNTILDSRQPCVTSDSKSQVTLRYNTIAYCHDALFIQLFGVKTGNISPVAEALDTIPVSVFENNAIVGNSASGVTLNAGSPPVDLGGGAGGSGGGNLFSRNGTFAIVNSSGSKISAKNNIWESGDPAEITSKYISPTGSVDVAPVMPVSSISFAQFAEAAGFTSTIELTNPSRTNGAAALLAFRNSAGAGANVKLNGQDSPGGIQPAAIAPLGVGFFSTDSATSAVNIGSVTAASGRPLAGAVLFSSAAGVAGVGVSELLTQFIAPVEKSTPRSVNSGIAVMNPSISNPVAVQLHLRDSGTGQVRDASLPLAAGGQAAKFVDELFSGLPADFVGTLSATAIAPVGATVIRTSPGQFATLPVTGTGLKHLVFAQFGEVAGVSSSLIFVNPSADRTASVTVKIFDDNGAPLTVSLNGVDRSGQFSFNIAPQGSVTFSSPGTSASPKVGSVVVDSTENIGGTILFGGSFGLAGVGREPTAFKLHSAH